MPDYFTLEEFRDLPDMDDDAVYTDDLCEAASDYIVGIIEREVGTSFIARTVTGEKHSGGGYVVGLKSPCVLSVSSATENGSAVTDTLDLDGSLLRKFSSGSYSPIRWSDGVRNISVTYSAGYSATPPDDIKQAAMQATRARLLETSSNAGIDERRTSLNTDAGVIQFTVAGEDRPTGYPTVDAVIVGWKKKLAPLTGAP